MQSEGKKILRFAAKMKVPSARSLGGKGFSEELAASNSASPRSASRPDLQHCAGAPLPNGTFRVRGEMKVGYITLCYRG